MYMAFASDWEKIYKSSKQIHKSYVYKQNHNFYILQNLLVSILISTSIKSSLAFNTEYPFMTQNTDSALREWMLTLGT